jgi:hypothetical protein
MNDPLQVGKIRQPTKRKIISPQEMTPNRQANSFESKIAFKSPDPDNDMESLSENDSDTVVTFPEDANMTDPTAQEDNPNAMKAGSNPAHNS